MLHFGGVGSVFNLAIKIFWSIEINDLWAKKICRPKRWLFGPAATFILRSSCWKSCWPPSLWTIRLQLFLTDSSKSPLFRTSVAIEIDKYDINPEVNKKPKIFKTIWHGYRGILKLFGRVNQASLKLSASFSISVCWTYKSDYMGKRTMTLPNCCRISNKKILKTVFHAHFLQIKEFGRIHFI